MLAHIYKSNILTYKNKFIKIVIKLMKKHMITLADIGDISFIKSRIARHINITIKPFQGVRVSVPLRVSFRHAERVVHERKDWLKKNLKKISQYEKRFTIFKEDTNYKTRNHSLEISSWENDKISLKVTADKIFLKYPGCMNVDDSKVQSAVRTGIVRALRKEAKEYLPERVKQIAEKHKFKYKQVFIKNHRSRWGSCSASNNINLNLHLMRLPDELIDYIIYHELCHTLVKNHSKKFYQLLAGFLPEYKAFEKELKNCSSQMF
ncbi:MAG: M48 family metallopeptidase [Spirochaetia bacterium]|nr:M48 family metallopeptidase [Spirochaetia bacterium]